LYARDEEARLVREFGGYSTSLVAVQKVANPKIMNRIIIMGRRIGRSD
jgi:hypothetical protein